MTDAELNEPDADDLAAHAANPLPTLTGYAAVFFDPRDPATTTGTDDDGAEQRLMPGAFRSALGLSRVVACFGHDRSRGIGDELGESLRLAVDARGLRFWVKPPDTPLGRAVVAAVRAGELTGASMTYRPAHKTEAPGDGGRLVRSLLDVRVLELGPVEHPRVPGACVWVEQPNADLDELERVLAVCRNVEREGG
jgi:uncharacterized protein